jgi:hypothetical protein
MDLILDPEVVRRGIFNWSGAILTIGSGVGIFGLPELYLVAPASLLLRT